jgi:hypothetical protein
MHCLQEIKLSHRHEEYLLSVSEAVRTGTSMTPEAKAELVLQPLRLALARNLARALIAT